MYAVVAERSVPDDPLAGLRTGDWPEPQQREGWATVSVRATALNHHDLWTLRGVAVLPGQLPVVLGSDAAGVDESGNEVIVYPVIGDPLAGGGDETRDPAVRFLSVQQPGTFAEQVAVPRRCLVPKPPEIGFTDAACLPGAWLTAYRMLFEKSGAEPGSVVLVQGAGGGVGTALVSLGRAAGYRVWAVSRSPDKRRRLEEIGAELVLAPGARLPHKVDAVLDTVGERTWAHSLRALRTGGRLVVSGATTGGFPPADLGRIFANQLSVVGSTMGTADQLARLAAFCVRAGIRPVVDRVLPLSSVRTGLAALESGEVFGKIVFTV
ncbi:zinc-binding dehydrogenase [Peterkaempfera bronchialis]|uniref:Zn-dependent oxidoreductase n=1 Tax=Peterkaempfera bronchialis TaxID=2126346 RepID=A0A345SU77_9ACTN|nr:zinc-binding dehydrogenase [Peterkaempfera bronchialis]AXI77282.1 Zn-dependent oxidoreductase [Peterkaempfera bronchialis]